MREPDCVFYSDENIGYTATNSLMADEKIQSRFMFPQPTSFDEAFTYFAYSITGGGIMKIIVKRCDNRKDSRLTMRIEIYMLGCGEYTTDSAAYAASMLAALCSDGNGVCVSGEDNIISAMLYLEAYLPGSMRYIALFSPDDTSGGAVPVCFGSDEIAAPKQYEEFVTLSLPNVYRDRFAEKIDKLYAANGLRFGVKESFEEIIAEKHLDDERREREANNNKPKHRRQKKPKQQTNRALKAHGEAFFDLIDPQFLARDFMAVKRSGASEEELVEYLNAIECGSELYRSYRALLLGDHENALLMQCILFLTGDIGSNEINSFNDVFPEIYTDHLLNDFSLAEIAGKVQLGTFFKIIGRIIKEKIRR